MGKPGKPIEVLDTPRRQSLLKEIGKDRLDELEKMIVAEGPSETLIIDTPARDRLRKKIGKEELQRIEARILSGEL